MWTHLTCQAWAQDKHISVPSSSHRGQTVGSMSSAQEEVELSQNWLNKHKSQARGRTSQTKQSRLK